MEFIPASPQCFSVQSFSVQSFSVQSFSVQSFSVQTDTVNIDAIWRRKVLDSSLHSNPCLVELQPCPLTELLGNEHACNARRHQRGQRPTQHRFHPQLGELRSTLGCDAADATELNSDSN